MRFTRAQLDSRVKLAVLQADRRRHVGWAMYSAMFALMCSALAFAAGAKWQEVRPGGEGVVLTTPACCGDH